MSNRRNQASATQLPAADHTEMRGAERFALLMRTAKLVSVSGEYLCIVRDVSASGVRLKMFHDVPTDRRMALKLANDDFYFIERVWQNGDQAGFQFSADIDVQQFLAEPSSYPRRAIRLGLTRPGLVKVGAQTGAAMMTNISTQGMAIESTLHLAIGQQVRLEIEGFPARHGIVRWRRGQQYGFALVESFRFEELAAIVYQLQPSVVSAEQTTVNFTAGCA